MPASIQPSVTVSRGVILTIGGLVGGDRVATVEPYITDSTALDDSLLCADLITSWASAARASYLAMLSASYSLMYISAEAMTNGEIPARADFTIGAYPGTIIGVPLPANVTGLLRYYRDPDDAALLPSGRMTVGKTFVPAVPVANVALDIIDGTLQGVYLSYALAALNGWSSSGDSGKKWFRCVAKGPRSPFNSPVPRAIAVEADFYVCTQRRRMIPRD